MKITLAELLKLTDCGRHRHPTSTGVMHRDCEEHPTFLPNFSFFSLIGIQNGLPQYSILYLVR